MLQSNKDSFAVEPARLGPGMYSISDKESPLLRFADSYTALVSGFHPSLFHLFAGVYKTSGLRAAPVAIPNSTGGYTATVSHYGAIPANSGNKQAAADFIAFMLEEEYQSTTGAIKEQRAWAHQLPVRLGCMAPLFKELGCGEETIAEMVKIEADITDACFVPHEFSAIVDAELERFYSGEVTAMEALQAIESRLAIYF